MIRHLSAAPFSEYYVFSSGGLGDVFKDYLTTHSWLKVKQARENYSVKFKVLLRTTCRYAADLFTYNPYLNEVLFQDFREDHYDIGLPRIVEEHFPRAQHEVMPIFVSPEEQEVIEAMAASERLVALHPFAGEDFRSWHNKLDLGKLVKQLVNQGYSVALLGGNHFREAAIRDQRSERQECFGYQHEGVFNLVGSGVRLCASAVHLASHVVASSSAYGTAAWCMNKKTMSIVPDGQFLPPGNWWYDVLYQKSTVVRFGEIERIETLLETFLND